MHKILPLGLLALLLLNFHLALPQVNTWHKEIVSENEVTASKIFLKKENNLAISGIYTWSTDFDPGPNQVLREINRFIGSSHIEGGYIAEYDTLGNYLNVFVDKTSKDSLKFFNRATDGFLSSAIDQNGNIVGVGWWLMAYKGSENNWEYFFDYQAVQAGIKVQDGGIMDAAFDDAGNIYICGYLPTNAKVDFDPTESKYELENPESDKVSCFFAKYTAQGNLVFAKKIDNLLPTTESSFPQQYNDIKSQIKVDNNGDLIISGRSISDFDLDPSEKIYRADCSELPQFPQSNWSYSPANSMYIAKYTSSGELKWGKRYCSSAIFSVLDLNTDLKNNIYIVGKSYFGTNPFSTTSFQSSGSGYLASSFMLKSSPEGNYLKSLDITRSIFANGAMKEFYTIEIDNSYSIYIGGGIGRAFTPFKTACDSITISGSRYNYNSNPLIIKYDSSLYYQWSYVDKTYTKPYPEADDFITSICLDKNSNVFYVGICDDPFGTGRTRSFFGKIVQPKPKIREEQPCLVLATDELLKDQDKYFDLFPNPLSKSNTLNISTNIDDPTIQLLSVDGRILQTFKMKNPSTLELKEIKSGIYIIKYQNENGISGYRKLMID